jgi:hypothetical protein
MKNVGTMDRLARVAAAAALLSCSALAPLPLVARVGLMAAPGIYLLATALFGSCLGYRLMGRSTCAPRRGGP